MLNMSTGVSFTLKQEGQKSEGAMPPVWKVEGPLAPWFHHLCCKERYNLMFINLSRHFPIFVRCTFPKGSSLHHDVFPSNGLLHLQSLHPLWKIWEKCTRGVWIFKCTSRLCNFFDTVYNRGRKYFNKKCQMSLSSWNSHSSCGTCFLNLPRRYMESN